MGLLNFKTIWMLSRRNNPLHYPTRKAITSFLLVLVLLKSNNLLALRLQTDTSFLHAFQNIESMLAGKEMLSFKRAVFVTENAYYGDSLSYSSFNENVRFLSRVAQKWMGANKNFNYKYKDSLNLSKNIAIYKVIEDTLKISVSKNQTIITSPFRYNYDDFLGKKKWSNVFVTTLLQTHRGNCHSLPYLYKILAEELVADCWLSFAPNHIYLKNRCDQIGWYNTELTSNEFPVDAWIMASGYVSPDAIRSGIYMDTLSDEQAIANCALDLAKGYERKHRIYTDSFIIKCCDLTLKYHPTNINAIIYKAETLRRMYISYKRANPVLASAIYPEMEQLYVHALDLGYKEMPETMYKEWLAAISKQKEKYSNKHFQEVTKKDKAQ